MVTVYVPAAAPPVVANVLAPNAGHKYVYGAVPPAPPAFTTPVALPKQFTGVIETVPVNAAGWLITADTVAVQPELSLTVTLYVPATNPVNAPVVFV